MTALQAFVRATVISYYPFQGAGQEGAMLSFRYLVAALIGAMAVLPSAAYPEEHKKYGAVKNCREFWITLRTFYQCFYRRNLIIATGRLSN